MSWSGLDQAELTLRCHWLPIFRTSAGCGAWWAVGWVDVAMSRGTGWSTWTLAAVPYHVGIAKLCIEAPRPLRRVNSSTPCRWVLAKPFELSQLFVFLSLLSLLGGLCESETLRLFFEDLISKAGTEPDREQQKPLLGFIDWMRPSFLFL